MQSLIDLIRRYQRYDPETGQFDCERTAEQYAALLGDGVYPSTMSRFYSGQLAKPWAVVHAFLRTFPQMAPEVAAAVRADAERREPADAIVA